MVSSDRFHTCSMICARVTWWLMTAHQVFEQPEFLRCEVDLRPPRLLRAQAAELQIVDAEHCFGWLAAAPE